MAVIQALVDFITKTPFVVVVVSFAIMGALATKIGSTIAELSQVMIGKADSIHRTFNTSQPSPQTTTNIITNTSISKPQVPKTNPKGRKWQTRPAAGPPKQHSLP